MPAPSAPQTPKVRLGVSTCLLGEHVRHDGRHRRDTFVTQGLGPWVQWVPVCPEVEVGMGVPREPVRLVGDRAAPRMVGVRSGRDWTEEMHAWAERRLVSLRALRLHGYVLTRDSPSCGAFAVQVHAPGDAVVSEGRGLWAAALIAADPLLAVEEDGRLADATLREDFVDRVFAHARWTRFLDEDGSRGGLVRFHTIHKLTLLSHAPDGYRRLGRIVAEAGRRGAAGAPGDAEDTAHPAAGAATPRDRRRPLDAVRDAYGRAFLETLAVPTTRGRHVNVLQHLAGFLRSAADAHDREEVARLIDGYRGGLVPLPALLTRFRHDLRRIPEAAWAFEQTYLDPYPDGLRVRSAV